MNRINVTNMIDVTNVANVANVGVNPLLAVYSDSVSAHIL